MKRERPCNAFSTVYVWRKWLGIDKRDEGKEGEKQRIFKARLCQALEEISSLLPKDKMCVAKG